MSISLKGHTPDFQYWVFDIDGKTWVAVNKSTQTPLNIDFVGRYRDWPSSLPLINTSGFNILGGTTTSTNNLGEKQGKVEWVWAGNRYLSTWVLSAGREISPADPEEGVPATFEYGLNFVGRTPYSGPTGGTVGSGGVTPPPVTTPPVTTPPVTSPPVTTPVTSPVVTPPTTPSVSPAGTDWVKLGLQLGAAYLLLK